MQTDSEEMKPYMTARHDLTFIVAQMTSGIKGVLPEQDDYELAGEIELMIEEKIQEFYDV